MSSVPQKPPRKRPGTSPNYHAQHAWYEANKEKAKAAARAHYAQNKEKRQAQIAAYREENREQILASYIAYNAAHPEERRAYWHAYKSRRRYSTKPTKPVPKPVLTEEEQQQQQQQRLERRKAKSQRFYARHRERLKLLTQAYRQAHPEKYRANNRERVERRRARKRHAPVNDFTDAQWQEMQAVYDYRCVYCHKRMKGHLTKDHITPLAKGGSHTASNIVPACRTCNGKKYTGAPLIPVQPLLLTIARNR